MSMLAMPTGSRARAERYNHPSRHNRGIDSDLLGHASPNRPFLTWDLHEAPKDAYNDLTKVRPFLEEDGRPPIRPGNPGIWGESSGPALDPLFFQEITGVISSKNDIETKRHQGVLDAFGVEGQRKVQHKNSDAGFESFNVKQHETAKLRAPVVSVQVPPRPQEIDEFPFYVATFNSEDGDPEAYNAEESRGILVSPQDFISYYGDVVGERMLFSSDSILLIVVVFVFSFIIVYMSISMVLFCCYYLVKQSKVSSITVARAASRLKSAYFCADENERCMNDPSPGSRTTPDCYQAAESPDWSQCSDLSKYNCYPEKNHPGYRAVFYPEEDYRHEHRHAYKVYCDQYPERSGCSEKKECTYGNNLGQQRGGRQRRKRCKTRRKRAYRTASCCDTNTTTSCANGAARFLRSVQIRQSSLSSKGSDSHFSVTTSDGDSEGESFGRKVSTPMSALAELLADKLTRKITKEQKEVMLSSVARRRIKGAEVSSPGNQVIRSISSITVLCQHPQNPGASGFGQEERSCLESIHRDKRNSHDDAVYWKER
ncbi:unnamed protein product [Cyprideis torosa]|uniref:Uncharacterized protein n=1 Tax=Cyprideis torosa TaxID=163714 RepID=A0A7R8ZQW1_9CRUS|nr:unnamed protein product [Cyprideis torosa]CAG0891600.1 unnamed protein product [Cyprideis torosa]